MPSMSSACSVVLVRMPVLETPTAARRLVAVGSAGPAGGGRIQAPRRATRLVRAAFLLLALPLALLWVSGEAAADSIAFADARLPSPRAWTSAVWDGTGAYIFGGMESNGTCECVRELNEVVRYTPADNTMRRMHATLPTARQDMSAVWTGRYAFLFGGREGPTGPGLNQILRYDPVADVVDVMTRTLPVPLHSTTAVWDGVNAYVFGGACDCGGSWISTILVYNPISNTLTQRDTGIPGSGGSAVWDGTNAYVLHDAYGKAARYTPATDTVARMGTNFPAWGTSAVTDGPNAFVFGGHSGQALLDQIVCYHLGTDTLAAKGVTLPSRRWGTSAVWNGTAAYVFGGYGGAEYYDFIDEVVQYVGSPCAPPTPPSAPRDLTATAGPGLGAISLAWTAPLVDGGSPITGYAVYRGASSGAQSATPVASLPPDARSYQDPSLPAGANYCYVVAASNAKGEGPDSNEACATTLGRPSAPRNLVAMPSPNGDNVALSWEPPVSDGGAPLTSYDVSRGSPAGAKTFLASVGANRLTFTDPDCPRLAACAYVVTAANAANGVSPPSNEATALGTFANGQLNPCAPFACGADLVESDGAKDQCDVNHHNTTLAWASVPGLGWYVAGYGNCNSTGIVTRACAWPQFIGVYDWGCSGVFWESAPGGCRTLVFVDPLLAPAQYADPGCPAGAPPDPGWGHML